MYVTLHSSHPNASGVIQIIIRNKYHQDLSLLRSFSLSSPFSSKEEDTQLPFS
jgi:hypothetical protein